MATQPPSIASSRARLPARDKGRDWLAQLNVRLGALLEVVAPTVWARVTRRVQLSGSADHGHYVRTSLTYDVCHNQVVPHIWAVRQVSPSQRVIAYADLVRETIRICYGQRMPLLNAKRRLGFRRLTFQPEVQLGVDVLALAPTVSVLVGDDDYAGCAVTPLAHPAVAAGVGGLYAAMMRWRFPLAGTLTVASFKVRGKRLDLQVGANARRIEDRRVTTVGLTGAMLTLSI